MIKKSGIRLRIDKDQHFMIDRKVINDMINSAQLKKSETVLEVGGGTGLLTRELAKKSGNVVTIEMDRRLIPELHARTKEFGNVRIIEGNALSIPFPKFNKMVSNIPYSISEPLLYKLMKHKGYDCAVLTVPKQFLQRLTAKPESKHHGVLSVMAPAFFKLQVIRKVSKEAFEPRPRVESVVIKLIPKSRDEIIVDKESFIVQNLFLRNQKIKNNVRDALWNFGPYIVGKPVTKREANTYTNTLLAGINEKILEKTPSNLSSLDVKLLQERIKNLSGKGKYLAEKNA